MSEEGLDRAVDIRHEDYTWIDEEPPPDGTYAGCLREFWHTEIAGGRPVVLGLWDDSVEPERELGAAVLVVGDVERLRWSENWDRVWFRVELVDGNVVDAGYDEALTNAHDFRAGDQVDVEFPDDWFERHYGEREEIERKLDRIAAYRDAINADDPDDDAGVVDRLDDTADS
jgi:hypothetical protein